MLFLTLVGLIYSIKVYVNNVQPFDNPSETYQYYTLPYCQPDDLYEAPETLGESLSGDYIMSSIYEFNSSVIDKQVCQQHLSPLKLRQFKDAINDNYYAEFYIGDYRLHDQIGIIKDGIYMLKNRMTFNIYHRNDTFLHANISIPQINDYVILSEDAMDIQFYYSATYMDIQLWSGDRFELDGDDDFKWSWILLKSALLILLIVQICCQFRRMLNRDFMQLADDENAVEPVGWKQIKVEALLPPTNKIVLSALIGTGIHILILLIVLLAMGVLGLYEQHKGSIKSTGIIIFAFSGVLNGYYTGKYYKFFGGKSWLLNLIIALLMFPMQIVCICTWLFMVAKYYNSTAAYPFQALFSIAFIMSVVYTPLTIIGGVAGRLRTIDQLPEKRFKKEIQGTYNHYWMFGLISFISVLLEVRYILSSVWGHYNFHQYLVMILSLLQLLGIVGCQSIILTYHQLNKQNYNWHWQSFMNGGSTAIFLFIYLIIHYLNSPMHGFIQLQFYLGYGLLTASGLWMTLGTVGYLASLKFVVYIYSSAKMN